ncbi:MAG: methylenetetrahydrofolate reductase [Atopobiaceae bacterium]|nr:methylenetetrahydrofolate reductase [Olsenella sp.]MDY3900937.1 methylenetetrahydrofolate reductase [Atopobiaceae bacterium]
MRIRDILDRKQTFSVEIFPPKGEMSVESARSISEQMIAETHPDWISVTFSAGGSGNSGNTLAISAEIARTPAPTTSLAHLTCLGSSRADVDAYLDACTSAGIDNVLALRGDRAPGREAIDFEHASDLVSYIKARNPQICVGGACYPEGHVECASLDEDVENLKRKQDAGVDFLVTQLFFENEDFYRFRERLVRARIKVPVVVGIMPFTSTRQIQRMAFSCGASIPAKVVRRLVAAGDSEEDQRKAGVEYAVGQLEDLAANGVDGLHIYSMNKPAVARDTYEALRRCGYVRG